VADLDGAETFYALFEGARQLGLERALEQDFETVIARNSASVRGWMREELRLLSRRGVEDGSVRALLLAGDDLFRGRELRQVRRAALDLARRHLQDAARGPRAPAPPGPTSAGTRETKPAAKLDPWRGQTAESLAAWARERHVGNLLDRRAYEVLRWTATGIWSGQYDPIALRDLEGETLRAILAEPALRDPMRRRQGLLPGFAPEPRSPSIRPDPLSALQKAAWSYLDEEARAVQRGLAAELALAVDQLPLPDDPALRSAVERLRALRVEIRKAVLPRATDRIGQQRLVFRDERHPSFVLEERGGSSSGDATLMFAAGPLQPSCSCRRKPSCVHALSLVDAILVLFGPDGDPTVKAPAQAALSQPPWKRALEGLDRILEQSQASGERAAAARLGWCIERDGYVVRVVPFLEERGKRGGWLKPRKVSLERLDAELLDASSETDRDVAELLELERAAARGTGSSEAVAARVLRKLIGHPRVLARDDGSKDRALRPIRVELAKVELVAIAGRETIRLLPSIGGKSFELEEFELVLEQWTVDDTLVRIDLAQGRCTITPIDERFLRMTSLLRRFAPEVPLSEQQELLRRVPALDAVLPVRFEGAIERTFAPPEPTIVVRLEPLPLGGLAVEARVRPIRNGASLVPGAPPAEVVAANKDRDLVFTRRDLDAEPGRVRERLAGLVPGIERDFSLDVSSADAALGMLERLEAAPDLVVEWQGGEPWRMVEGRGARFKIDIADRGDWFGLSGGLDLGRDRVELAVLLEAARSGRRYVEVRDSVWLKLSDALKSGLESVEAHAFVSRSGLEVGGAALPELERVAASDGAPAELERPPRWIELARRWKGAEALEPKIPVGLVAELRPYQIEGHAWLSRLAAWGMGACLADDMGLGKTLQALAVLVDRAASGPALVVAPTSVTHNWLREAARFAPGLRVHAYRGAARAERLTALGAGEVVVASYGLVLRDVEALSKVVFSTLVLDEAQAIKNPDSRRSRAVRQLSADFRFALTGTPVENHLGELWSLFRAVAPGLLGSWEQFRERFVQPIERLGDKQQARTLSRLIRPFVLRRTKAEVAKDLPPRTEVEVDVELSPRERALYEDARLNALAQLGALSATVAAPEQRFHVLAALTRLRQLACHPRLADPLSEVSSSKLERLLELLLALLEEGQRALIFSQFTKHLALVKEALDRAGVRCLELDGSTPSEARADRVAAFQAGQVPVFLISLKAGGTGLNLTAAENVIHLDPWWNPAVEDQASGRAHRIGQTKPVTVYRLVARGTIEEAILKLHGEKRALVSELLEGTGGAAHLTTTELIEMIRSAALPSPDEAGDEVTEALDGGDSPEARPSSGSGSSAEPSAENAVEAAAPEAPELGVLRDRFAAYEAALWDDVARERLDASSVRTYLRLARRFVSLAERSGNPAIAASLERAEVAYLTEVERGIFPSSDRAVAPVVLRRLFGAP
jgi:superfamily II DNA or RNA helicase